MKNISFITLAVAISALSAIAACGTEVVTLKADAIEHGQKLFYSTETSPSKVNAFNCGMCHTPGAVSAADRVYTGAPLAGSPSRPSYWGGQVTDFLDAINDCRISFMSATDPWTASDPQAQAIFAYLSSLPGGTTDAVPFTVIDEVKLPPAGDAASGKTLYDRACSECHGVKTTGAGKVAPRAPSLPEQTLNEHAYLPAAERPAVFVEKVRHGVFLGYSGTMPLFSAEVLSDADLGAILRYLDLYK